MLSRKAKQDGGWQCWVRAAVVIIDPDGLSLLTWWQLRKGRESKSLPSRGAAHTKVPRKVLVYGRHMEERRQGVRTEKGLGGSYRVCGLLRTWNVAVSEWEPGRILSREA